MNPLEVMKQALDALEDVGDEWGFTSERTLPNRRKAITNLKIAIAELESAEPVFEIGFGWLNAGLNPDGTPMPKGTKLYLHPAQSRDSIIEECAVELENGISVGIEANTIFEYCAKKVRALKGK